VCSPHPIAPILRHDLDLGEMPGQQPVEGDAALHDDLQQRAGVQMRRGLGDQLLELSMVLGDAPM